MENKNTYGISILDTNRFGFKVGKIYESCIDIDAAVNKLFLQNIELIIARVKAADIEKINRYEGFGFRVKDVQLKYKYDIKSHVLCEPTSDVYIREAMDRDLDDVIDITANSFYNYGHYFANKELPRNSCIEIYKDWAKRSIRLESQIANRVFVAMKDEKIVGFLSFILEINEEGYYARGGLGAVKAEYRGCGVFHELVQSGVNWGKMEKMDWQEHNVLIHNKSVNSVFTGLGFKVDDSFVTMHCFKKQFVQHQIIPGSASSTT
jgi:hypothetical protein